MGGEVVRYAYRLRPGARAERALLDVWHRCRFLWNEAVHQHKLGQKPTFGKLSKLLTAARGSNTWLRKGSQVAQQQTLRTYSQALDHSFTVRGRGRPQPKSRKKALPSLEYTTRGFSIRDRRLVLSKGVSVPVVWSQELPSTPTSVRVYRDSLGHWYASFVVRREARTAPVVDGGIGVDWGVTTTATSYQRARRQAAKLHKKTARQTKHDSRVWAKKVVDNHQLIAVEDFRPRFLARSTMARKAADAAIGAAKRELIDRAGRAGRKVVIFQPAYTTMTCSSCFARAKQQLERDERIFRCQTCGHTDSRDRNAARVVLAVAERGHTSVDGISHFRPPPRSVDGAA
ncbi:RNA-guided endonuclease InsQ/TnpB family protein [Rhodococcus xishaensis]|uniref:Transposase n=1 Tax=Rhodococcus xishaensis TaxID=2487364 RepID=A0A3S3E036_9NOCA|nr:zinc ribbon domain-containing protein [Rhodococcus xishaensis]RVW02867.1 transposase [Rhodococcus xishaensis]